MDLIFFYNSLYDVSIITHARRFLELTIHEDKIKKYMLGHIWQRKKGGVCVCLSKKIVVIEMIKENSYTTSFL